MLHIAMHIPNDFVIQIYEYIYDWYWKYITRAYYYMENTRVGIISQRLPTIDLKLFTRPM